MARGPGSGRSRRRPAKKDVGWESLTNSERRSLVARLRGFVRVEGPGFLKDPNITSIGIGLKIRQDAGADELLYSDHVCIQFTVGTKVETEADIEALDSTPIPEKLVIDGEEFPTDVIERDFSVSYTLVGTEAIEETRRKVRRDPLVPGVSIGHPTISAGTLGMVVYDQTTGRACMLSNWHVLHGNAGDLGDPVVQPGRHDDNRTDVNITGRLTRSHLGLAGDCAIAEIAGRRFDPIILDLDVTPTKLVRVELLDNVVKSGRTTGITWGVVRRIDVMAQINYGGDAGVVTVGGFEIGPDPDRPAERLEISLGGDSGSTWLIANDDAATDMLAGLHFAGETGDNPDEHALACYPHAVMRKLNIALTPPKTLAETGLRRGYDPHFLIEPVPPPELHGDIAEDAFEFGGAHLVPYTHFSVCQSRSRALPRFVAWNIDGGALKRISRNGIRFRLDPRIDRDAQTGNELYRNNPLDRGHVARRADLCWGSLEEAKQANFDSFFYSNITPQHERFNQSSQGGLWGDLENAIFDDVPVGDLKVSLMAGPIFADDDPLHRGVAIPRQYWKLIGYHDLSDERFKVRAFVLTQRDLLTDLEVLELDEFKMFEVSLAALGELTDLDFGAVSDFGDFQIDRLGQASERLRGPLSRGVRLVQPGERVF